MLNKTYKFKKTALLFALAGALGAQSAQAANWLMLQGTEKDHQGPRAKVWGFVQADYMQTDDTKLKAGPYVGKSAAFNQLGPQLTSSQGFNIRRARIAVRGNNFPLDEKVNYFLMAEFGNNGITTGGKASQGQLTDASVTLNHIPGARIRAGLFKTPGAEEGLQGIGVFNYVNFTNVTDRLVLERFYDNAANNTGRNGPVSAFRDTGVQVFDSFRQGDWEHSYAVMLGNGNGLALQDNDKHQDLYLYASTEKIFGDSKGPRRHGMKFFAWMQDGKRTLDDVGTVDRKRSGLGTTYWDGKYRLAAEYITADGMIYGGTKGAGTPADGATFSVFPDEKATGYYVDLGYRVLPNLELNARYDMLDAATETAALHRELQTTTLGAQYFFNKKTSLKVNYEIRNIDAPDLPAASPVHDILDSLDNRVSAQLTVVY
ncbi:porin [Thiomicrorhabdus sp. ZW0627]|uniref:porin n=1 Tax=Thiomicrorhabdus sp. ZW0627 TaxID=3039774 RepID=UPI00243688B2|nr:porin [Thiomicrorhabdus sp. ZW0627]MDG6774217.1 porin [Thiomicrorhabdus sp. ZW0627]